MLIGLVVSASEVRADPELTYPDWPEFNLSHKDFDAAWVGTRMPGSFALWLPRWGIAMSSITAAVHASDVERQQPRDGLEMGVYYLLRGVVILPALIAVGMGSTTPYYNPFRTGAAFGPATGPELSIAPHRGWASAANLSSPSINSFSGGLLVTSDGLPRSRC